jgi:hypothetical protein
MIPETHINGSPREVLRIQAVVRLRPKRRFKIDPESVEEEIVHLPVPIPALPRPPRMKRSGRVHQQWQTPTEFCPWAPKISTASEEKRPLQRSLPN